MFTFDPVDEALELPPWLDFISVPTCLPFGVTGVFGRKPGGIFANSEVCCLRFKQGYFTLNVTEV